MKRPHCKGVLAVEESKKENLRDNMTNRELVLNMLAELTTKGFSENSDPQTMQEHAEVALKGATVARNARIEME